VLAALLAAAGGAAFASGLPGWVWQPPLVLAGVWLGFSLCRTPVLEKGALLLAGALRHPRAQAAALLGCAAALLCWQSYRLDGDVAADTIDLESELGHSLGASGLVPHDEEAAQTDAGRAVALFRPRAGWASPIAEEDYLRKLGLSRKLIQTDATDPTYNCHGWIFAAGRCWVRGETIEQILKDNGYRAVSRPEVGDLAIFRDAANAITHSALVRGSGEEGVLLLESKWGQLGRYIHTSSEHLYGHHQCTYYRSTRGSHLLRGVNGRRYAPVGAGST
jgi:hypothetical protein